MRKLFLVILVLGCAGCVALVAQPARVNQDRADASWHPSIEVEKYQTQFQSTVEMTRDREFSETKIKTENTETTKSHERIVTVTKEVVEVKKPPYVEMMFRVSSYCPCTRCCSAGLGITANGESAWHPGIASDWGVVPPGTIVDVPGYGTFPVDDKFGRRKHNTAKYRLDVRQTYHWEARDWGVQWLKVKVYGIDPRQ